jgi:hypothetical protein
VQQLASPVVRVRRLDVRAASLSAVEKVELFAAIARLRSKAAEIVRSASTVSLSEMARSEMVRSASYGGAVQIESI